MNVIGGARGGFNDGRGWSSTRQGSVSVCEGKGKVERECFEKDWCAECGREMIKYATQINTVWCRTGFIVKLGDESRNNQGNWDFDEGFLTPANG